MMRKHRDGNAGGTKRETIADDRMSEQEDGEAVSIQASNEGRRDGKHTRRPYETE